MKQVIITNGYPGSGKDEFAKILNNYITTAKYSSIDCVRNGASEAGWYNGEKKEKDRKFLSDLKKLLTSYKDIPFKDMKYLYDDFKNELFESETQILIFDIREPDEIERAVKEFNAITVFISNSNVTPILSNDSDANVENYQYDYYIDNSGTLADFEANIKVFCNEIIQKID